MGQRRVSARGGRWGTAGKVVRTGIFGGRGASNTGFWGILGGEGGGKDVACL